MRAQKHESQLLQIIFKIWMTGEDARPNQHFVKEALIKAISVCHSFIVFLLLLGVPAGTLTIAKRKVTILSKINKSFELCTFIAK